MSLVPRILLSLGVCLGALLLASPAPAQYHFDSWTTENGLPQNTIRAIVQTHDGYLWLASLDGLVRFDGVHFTVFTTANTPALRSNRCTSLFEDQAGQLWIGTEDGGLVKQHDGVFTTFTTDQGLPGNEVRQVWADDQGSCRGQSTWS
jgi:ligand-binding sensor domain-containing protein